MVNLTFKHAMRSCVFFVLTLILNFKVHAQPNLPSCGPGNDFTPPVINVPNDTTVSAPTGLCSSVFNFDLPDATDNCPAPNSSQIFLYSGPQNLNDASSSTSPGITTSTITVSGMNNNLGSSAVLSELCLNLTHSRDQDVTITITSPQGTVYTLTQNNGGTGANYQNTCFNMSSTLDITSGIAPFSGVFIPQGAGGFANFDNEDPNGDWTLTIIDDTPSETGILSNWSLNILNVGFNVVQTGGLPSGSTYPVGVTTNVFQTTDAAGNVGTASFVVTVEDNEVPSISCAPGFTVNADRNQCSAVVSSFVLPTVSDNCGILSVTNDAPSTFPVGITTVTWTVTDVNGNTNTCTQDIEVIDNQDRKSVV